MKKKQLFNYYRYFAVLYCASFFYVQSLICFYFMLSIFTFLFELIRINLMCDSFTRLLCSKSTLKLMQYRKILLIRPGRIYGQKTNLMGLFFGGEGGGWVVWGLIYGGLIFGICYFYFFFPDFFITKIYNGISRTHGNI